MTIMKCLRCALGFPGKRKQRGFSLWELAVLLGILGVVLVAGFALLRASEARQIETDRTNLLAAADRAIASFAAAKGRLPCPDTDAAGTGLEDCSGAAQKGWLPVVTLGLTASAPARGALKLRYVVYRGSGNDLAVLSERYAPPHWEFFKNPSEANTFVYNPLQLSLPDFCVALRGANLASANAANAYVNGASGNVINVAYALADAGQDRDGDGNSFDGPLNNQTGTNGLESPARSADRAYDDRVFARSFNDLTLMLDCQQVIRSLDVMAQSVEVVNEVQSQKDWAKTFAIIMTSVDAVKTVISGFKLGNAIAAVSTATAALTAASAGLATNAALCAAIITAPVGCPLAAIYGTGVGLATAAIVAAGVAIAANTAALITNAVATVETGIIAGKASAAASSTTPNSLADTVAALLAAYNTAVGQAAIDKTASDAARSASNTALGTYNQKVVDLKTVAHVHDTTGSNDAALNTALQAYVNYSTAQFAFYDADGAAKAKRRAATEAVTAAANALADYNAAVLAATNPNGVPVPCPTPSGTSTVVIICVTQSVATAAAATAAAAKAASTADPTNLALITAATNASIASINANIEAANAAQDSANYIANKLSFSNSQQAAATQLAADATALEAAAVTAQTNANNLLTTYNNAVTTAANSTAYNYNISSTITVCDISLPIIGCVKSHTETILTPASDKQLVLNAFTNAKNAYDDYVAKDKAATKLEQVTAASAKNVVDSLAAYNSLLAASNGTPGTGLPIVVGAGAEVILQRADEYGGMK